MTRWLVQSRFPTIHILLLEVIVWVSTEWLGWMIGEAPAQPGSLLQFTTGAVWAEIFGLLAWMFFGATRIRRPAKKLWQIEATLRILIAFFGFMILATIGMVTIMKIGETVNQLSNLIFGIISAGLSLRAFIGAITGIIIIKISLQRIPLSASVVNPTKS